MLIRIVRMHFKAENVSAFEALFAESRSKVASQPGCSSLQLCRDYNDPTVFFTISHWDEESSLNQYRDSALFADIWSRTKVLFADKPKAYSLRPE